MIRHRRSDRNGGASGTHRRRDAPPTATATHRRPQLQRTAAAALSPNPVVSRFVPAFAVGYVLVLSFLGTLAMTEADRIEIERVIGVGTD